jgi:hypothetical protein
MKNLDPEYIVTVHEITDDEKYQRLLDDFDTTGYNGEPIIVVKDKSLDNIYHALNGTHRIFAARAANIDIPAHIVEADNDTASELLGVRDDFELEELACDLLSDGKIDKETYRLVDLEVYGKDA